MSASEAKNEVALVQSVDAAAGAAVSESVVPKVAKKRGGFGKGKGGFAAKKKDPAVQNAAAGGGAVAGADGANKPRPKRRSNELWSIPRPVWRNYQKSMRHFSDMRMSPKMTTPLTKHAIRQLRAATASAADICIRERKRQMITTEDVLKAARTFYPKSVIHQAGNPVLLKVLVPASA